MHTAARAKRILSLSTFAHVNGPEEVGTFIPACPLDNQQVLRMIVRLPHEGLQLPPEVEWTRPLFDITDAGQRAIGIAHPFCYLTIRHGPVQSVTDDEWHVDGFSTKISHLPEQNYIVADSYPTEYVERAFHFPNGFDPLAHNVHRFFQSVISQGDIRQCKVNKVYCLDPYVPHRRVSIPADKIRTFLRVSYTPVEIMDDANTPNPLIPMRRYNRDGVAIRNKLAAY